MPEDFDAEYRVLTETAGLAELSGRGLLQMTGDDRVRFLNGQTTNDVTALRPGQLAYSVFVNAKGKMRADAHIFCMPDRFWIELEPGCDRRLAADLEKFTIADDVTVEVISADHAQFLIAGPKAADTIAGLKLEPPEPGRFTQSAEGTLVFSPFFGGEPAFRVILFARNAPAFQQAALQSARRVGPAALEARRVELGVPRFGADMTEDTLPPEAGIENRAISYTKGCYIGQEVISRIKSVGHVNRRLVRLRFEPASANVSPGAKLSTDAGPAGFVTSAASVPQKGRLGLGYVHRTATAPSQRLKGDGFEAIVL